MGDGATVTTAVDSCLCNYSNFDDEQVIAASATISKNVEEDLAGDGILAKEFLLGEVKRSESDGDLLGCVLSSQEELAKDLAGKEILEEDEQGSPGCGKSLTGVVSTSGDGGRKARPKGWSKKKGVSATTTSIIGISEMQEPTMTQEGGIALWVKWRGKWRACIQCYPSDCSSATVRAMPTYSKKTYVVVFFPNSRTYSWVDLEYACHITESPEPLAFGTHQSGRDAVENLDLPKHHMLRVLAANMLDISDRLPIKAVVDSAQNVNAWKTFANQAVESKEYSDVSKMLVKLFGMIQLTCYNETWLQESFNRWKNDCEVAKSAQTVEHLNKELVNAVLWETVHALWDAPEQSAVGTEWKDWKRAVIENRSVYPSISMTPDSSLFADSETLKRRRLSSDAANVELALKRSKLDVRRRYPTQLIPVSTPVKKEDEVNGYTADNQQRPKAPSAEVLTSTPASVPKSEDDDLSGRSSSLINQSTAPISKRLSSNYQLCAAYMEKKKRQCTRFPSQGSLYCCKHMSLAFGDGIEGVKKLEYTPPPPPPPPPKAVAATPKSSTTIIPKMPGDKICEGITKYGRRCTHRAKEDSLFCKKHSFADAPHLNPQLVTAESSQRATEENVEPEPQQHEFKEEAETDAKTQQEPPTGEDVKEESSPRRRKVTASIERARNYSWHLKRMGRIIRNNGPAATRVRCLGRCVNGDQCSHKSRPGSFYCEKHQPDSNSQQEDAAPSEVKKLDEAQTVLKAKSWLSRYMESAKMEGASTSDTTDSADKLLDWVLAEASKDIHAATALMKLVNQRKDKLGRFLKLQERAEASKPTPEGAAEVEGKCPEQLSGDQAEQKQQEKIKCSICDDEFAEMVELGNHWKASHETEAHWFLKGYACKECNKEFTNKSSLERHCKTDHEALTDVPAVHICINCDEQFPHFEALWDHVVSGHSDHLSAMPTLALPAEDPAEDTKMPDDDLVTAEEPFPVLSDDNQQDSLDDEDFMDIPSSDYSADEMEALEYLDGNCYSVDNDGSEHKYTCKLCGKKFRALPDLGRHHQAVHMSSHVGTISKSRTGVTQGNRSNRRRGKLSQHGMNSILRIKKALHSVQQQKSERSEAERGAAAKLPGPPGDDEILAAARSACCEARFYRTLEEQYDSVPKGTHANAVKLAAPQEIEWARDGFTCPQNCTARAPERTSEMRLHVFRKGAVAASARKKSVVLCEDISFGKERVPVPCVEDEETDPCNCLQCREGKSYHVDSLKPWETFSYVTDRLLDPSLGLDTKDSQIGCSCGRGRCSSRSCDHVEMFDSDYADACDIWGEEMLRRFPYDGEGRIVLQEGYLVYECNTSCMCSEECPNRVLQRGVKVKLEVFKTRHKGWAVRAAQNISRGTFVCEYLGEVLNDQEANRRGERYDQVGCSYLYDIDVHLNTGGRSRRGPSRVPRIKPFVIDATKHGNVARFINHSCSPNLVNYQVLVESMDYQLAHIGLFASRDILCGEELSYDYRYKLLPGRGCPCHCGSSGCRGRLY
ncbi:histone-lysine N-methyltransferase SUVR5 [Selaginella moellendorffii]|nr:histone-lysine N-methyltransferase SUVR5 [Selaginella moellendorffii]|eukprot:XP_002986381.2 histone-lysine N-methyltransferase SUVR5 [Selaginella moellendorffii]